MTELDNSKIQLAIPLFGKMGTRTFHTSHVKNAFSQQNIKPTYYISPHHYDSLHDNLKDEYGILQSDQISEFLNGSLMSRHAILMRYFCTLTESADLRFREYLENMLFQYGSISRYGLNVLLYEIVRRIPGVGRLTIGYEKIKKGTNFHTDSLRCNNITGVLTPGLGNWSFVNELFFARESQKSGLPVFAVITNYDNLINKGYRGFLPDLLAVWSQQMADDAMRYHNIPASRIEITGPVQYDAFVAPLQVSRKEFLENRGLDPDKKTILYAASSNLARLIEFYDLIIRKKTAGLIEKCNVIIRAYPAPRTLAAPEWFFLKELLEQVEGVYLSDPLPFEVENIGSESNVLDLWGDQDIDELHGLLVFSDVMLNHYSTISLEAAICDLPTIHIDYDDNNYGKQYKLRTEFLRRMTHNKRPERLKAAKLVTSQAEMLAAIEDYLGDPAIHRVQRSEYARHELGELDGQSCNRLAQMINDKISLRGV